MDHAEGDRRTNEGKEVVVIKEIDHAAISGEEQQE